MWQAILSMESGVLRALLVAFFGLVGMVLSYFGVDEALFGEKAERFVDAILLVITTFAVFWAAYKRANAPNPNLTEAANREERRLILENKIPLDKATLGVAQSMGKVKGFALPGFLVAIVMVLLTFGLVGCNAYKDAIKNADDPPDYAFVMGNVYSSYLDQAIAYKSAPGARADVVKALQELDIKLGKAVEALGNAANSYRAVTSATTQAELQKAVDDVVRLLAQYIVALRSGGASPTGYLQEWILNRKEALELS